VVLTLFLFGVRLQYLAHFTTTSIIKIVADVSFLEQLDSFIVKNFTILNNFFFNKKILLRIKDNQYSIFSAKNIICIAIKGLIGRIVPIRFISSMILVLL
jgi:hypothetical protein